MSKKSQKLSETNYCCPFCDKPLLQQWGNQMNPGNKDFGVTLFCQHGDPEAKTHPQEVYGHGNGRSDDSMLQHAYAVIEAKYCGGKLANEGDLVEVTEEAA